MKNLNIKTTSALIASSFLMMPWNASADDQMVLSKLQAQMREVGVTNARGTFGAKLADASPNIDGYGFYITADALIYQLLEDNNDFAIEVPSTSSTSGSRKTYETNFDWSFGFKTGIGYYAEHDNWQSGFEFAWLQTQEHKSATPKTGYTLYESQSLIQLADGIDSGFYKANDHWNVHYYNLDWRIGRDFFVSKYLSLLPELGIKSTWIYQNRKTSFYLSDLVTRKHLSAQDNFNGVGPKADLKAKWHLGRNFSLIGGVDVALLFASNKTSYNQNCVAEPSGSGPLVPGLLGSFTVSNNIKKNHVSPFLGLNIGFSYDTNFMDDAFNFGIKVMYEQLYYNKASRIMNNDTPSYRDVSFQGVDVSLEFSF